MTPNSKARIQAFELAFRMQAQAPEAFEVEGIPKPPKSSNGMDEEVTKDFGWQRPLSPPPCRCAVYVTSSARTATSGISTPTSWKATPKTA
jgi:hypothetical protein